MDRSDKRPPPLDQLGVAALGCQPGKEKAHLALTQPCQPPGGDDSAFPKGSEWGPDSASAPAESPGVPPRLDVVLRVAGARGSPCRLVPVPQGSGFAYSRVVDTDTTGLHSDSPDGLVTFSRNRCRVRGSRPPTTCLVAYPLDGRHTDTR